MWKDGGKCWKIVGKWAMFCITALHAHVHFCDVAMVAMVDARADMLSEFHPVDRLL